MKIRVIGTKGWARVSFLLDKPIRVVKQHKVHGIMGTIMTKHPMLLSPLLNFIQTFLFSSLGVSALFFAPGGLEPCSAAFIQYAWIIIII
jgi:hypothetical protein